MAALVWVGAAAYPALAHWPALIDSHAEAATGNLDKSVSDDLEFPFDECVPGTSGTECHKFDSDVIGDLPLSFSFGGVTFEITGWIEKSGAPGEYVGFYYTVTGGSVDIDVKSGTNNDLAALPERSGSWVRPDCVIDGGGTTATCNPANTAAISHIVVCITTTGDDECPEPLMDATTITNEGTIPLTLALEFLDPLYDPPSVDYCDPPALDLTIHVLDGLGDPIEPPPFDGSPSSTRSTPATASRSSSRWRSHPAPAANSTGRPGCSPPGSSPRSGTERSVGPSNATSP